MDAPSAESEALNKQACGLRVAMLFVPICRAVLQARVLRQRCLHVLEFPDLRNSRTGQPPGDEAQQAPATLEKNRSK